MTLIPPIPMSVRALVVALGLAAALPASAQPRLARAVVASGGTSSGGSFTLRSVVGEPVIGVVAAGPLALCQSFVCVAAPGGGGPIVDEPDGPVEALALAAPAPNPSAGPAEIGFAVPSSGPVRLAVYDVRGREVAVLVDRVVEAGRHRVSLDDLLAAGAYMVRLRAGHRTLTHVLTVVR